MTDDTTWYTPTKEDLKAEAPVRQAIESALDAWAPNYISDGRVQSYDDWIDQALEGLYLEGDVRLTCGTNQIDFPYPQIRRIAQRVAKDHR